MKKTVITLTFASLSMLVAQGRTLSPGEALNRAMQSADIPTQVAAMRTPRQVTPELTLNVISSDAPALYVISCGEGHGSMVVSADDVAAPILAYSDEPFDIDSAPENFKWWLTQYQAEISQAIEANLPAYDEAAAAPARATIAPLVTTKWDQDAPYYNKCPKVGTRYTYTGCVATAMAQVINYHKHPVTGTGSHSYTWNNTTLTFNYGATTFDWANMLNSYNGSATEAQKNAVATLMYACGVAVDMNYGTSASGAVSSNVPAALRDYFGFDKGVHYEDRLVYTSQGWEDLVYSQIVDCGPTYYSGRGESGGHAFVVDGYKDGFFHFNWGWSGVSDGYYRLYALVPGSQGIGGNSEGFNTGQSIVAGICKPKPGSQLPPPYFICTNPLDVQRSGTTMTLNGPFYCYTPYTTTGYFVIEYYDKATGQYLKTQKLTTASNIRNNTYYQQLKFSVTAIPEGECYAYPKIEVDGVVTPIHFSPWNPGGYFVTKRTGSDITIESPRGGIFSTTGMDIISPMYTNRLFAVNIPYTYTGQDDVLVTVTPQLRDASTGVVKQTGEQLNAIIVPGNNKIEYTGTWLNNPAAGNYSLVFISDMPVNMVDGTYSNILGGPQAVSLTAQSGSPMMTVSASDWSIVDANNVNPDNLVINANVNCIMGYFAGALIARIYEQGQTQNPIAEIRSNNVFLSGGAKYDVTIAGEMVGGETGKTYDVLLYNTSGSKLTTVAKQFTLGTSAIEDVVADSSDLPVKYYNLQGQPVVNPMPGSIVIRRQGDKTEKTIVK
ncbi:MAG: C10 family peptidase [Duncaniella sp.]|nr:C10 family peptidase [Duncaniella sp.]